VVQQTNPPTGEQKLFYVDSADASTTHGVRVGAEITFSWTEVSQKFGATNAFNLISVNKENPR
jgi:hypothetical protein